MKRWHFCCFSQHTLGKALALRSETGLQLLARSYIGEPVAAAKAVKGGCTGLSKTLEIQGSTEEPLDGASRTDWVTMREFCRRCRQMSSCS